MMAGFAKLSLILFASSTFLLLTCPPALGSASSDPDLSINAVFNGNDEPTCIKNTIIGCPIVEGVQKRCFCTRVCSNCCSCVCPEGYEWNSTEPVLCARLPELLGQECQHASSTSVSCKYIPNSECVQVQSPSDAGGQKSCVCKTNRFPSNNLRACISIPTKLGQPCSDQIQCPTSIQHSACVQTTTEEGDYECGCEAGYYADSTNTTCIVGPRKVGDTCSAKAKCDLVGASECSSATNTCSCLPRYSASQDLSSCLPTRLGMKCPANSDCSLLPGSVCYGSPTESESICICPFNLPNYELTKCLGF